jgi:DNA repair exonuclease SbcCD ATPase subunit
VSREKEEILTDPGNHAVLRQLASEEEIELQEAAEAAGMEENRLRERSEDLEKHGFIEKNYSAGGISLRLSRGNLEEFSEDILDFLDEHEERIEQNLESEEKHLADLKRDLEQRKEETNVLKKEKKLERQIEVVEDVLDSIGEFSSPEEKLEAFSRVHRVHQVFDSGRGEFTFFNPRRKVKALRKAREVLEEEPDQEEPKRFFGNRWVTDRELEEGNGRV